MQDDKDFRVWKFLREKKLFSAVFLASAAAAIAYGVWDFYLKPREKILDVPSITQAFDNTELGGVESLVDDNKDVAFVSGTDYTPNYVYGLTEFVEVLDTYKNPN